MTRVMSGSPASIWSGLLGSRVEPRRAGITPRTRITEANREPGWSQKSCPSSDERSAIGYRLEIEWLRVWHLAFEYVCEPPCSGERNEEPREAGQAPPTPASLGSSFRSPWLRRLLPQPLAVLRGLCIQTEPMTSRSRLRAVIPVIQIGQRQHNQPEQ